MNLSYFVLHGSFGSPFENWFPWLHSKLNDRKFACFVPSFPTPQAQTFENWASIMDGYRNAGLLSEKTCIVAHSSAAIFAVKYLLSRKLHVQRIITIAGFNNFFSGHDDFDSINAEFFVTQLDLVSSKKYFARADCFFSSSDPYLPVSVLKNFCTELGGIPHEVPNAGHFNSQAGYTTFEQLVNLLITD